MKNWQTILIPITATIRDAIAAIEHGAVGIALVVTEENRLIGTITDGDIRRAILRNVPLTENVQELLMRPLQPPYAQPITAPVSTPENELLATMHLQEINQIPLMDNTGHVVGLVTLSELTQRRALGIPAVVMAGGFGTRLYPCLLYTSPSPRDRTRSRMPSSA